MATSPTNKQPLLVDRPMLEFARLGPSAALVDPTNLSSIISGGCVALVDCSANNNEGGVCDSLFIIANQASTTAARALFFLSTATSIFGINTQNTVLVASAVISSGTVGQRTDVSLPPLNIPVPHLGAQAAPTEFTKKNTGLYIPGGRVLYVGLSETIISPSPSTTVSIFAQGGYF